MRRRQKFSLEPSRVHALLTTSVSVQMASAWGLEFEAEALAAQGETRFLQVPCGLSTLCLCVCQAV